MNLGVRRHFGSLLVLPALCALSCSVADPAKVIGVQDVEGYWVVDKEKSPTNYITPTIRLGLKNLTADALPNVQATATFKRKGEDSAWGDAFVTVASRAKPLLAGQVVMVEMRSSSDYYTPGAPVAPEKMFEHKLFKDATVNVFVRVGRSGWVKMASAEIPRHLNSSP
jgi:hypothetical protein